MFHITYAATVTAEQIRDRILNTFMTFIQNTLNAFPMLDITEPFDYSLPMTTLQAEEVLKKFLNLKPRSIFKRIMVHTSLTPQMLEDKIKEISFR